MQQDPSSDSEFFIGWQAAVPPGHARRTRRFVVAVSALVPLLAFLLVWFQSGFSAGVFELGKETVVEGRLALQPVPFLMVENGHTQAGKPLIQQILLLSPGKFGAEKILFADPRHAPGDGQRIQITGNLIYHDGKTALQINAWKTLDTASQAIPVPGTTLGAVTLRGEVTDPKCLLGVMKPGRGQPHRDCAVRCIAGGIPPALKVTGASGETEYYLLVGPAGERLNQTLLPHVADGIEICGRLEQQGDWWVLYADPATLRSVDPLLLQAGSRCN